MKSFFTSCQKTVSSFLASLNFRKSLLLSIAAHGLMFVLFSGMLVLFSTPKMTRPPLVFDFVAVPSPEPNRSPDADQGTRLSQEPAAPKKRNGRSQPQPDRTAASGPRRPRLPYEPAPPKLPDVQPGAMQPLKFVQTEVQFPVVDRYALQAVTPKPAERRSELVPAQIRIPEKQHDMLQKKFKKWTENFHRMELPDSTLSWEHDDKTYTARFRQLPAASDTDLDEVLVEVVTQVDGVPVKTQMRMQRLAFSSYAQFVDYWHPWVAVHNDELDGRFHSNSEINISTTFKAQPKFHGKVTTASWDVRRTGTRAFFDDRSVFLGGLETGVEAIQLPGNVMPFAQDSTIREHQVHQLPEEDTRIVFHPDGTYSWNGLKSRTGEQHRPLPQEAFYILGAEDKKLFVRGVVRGKVLLYSPQKIIIQDDLTYARYPEVVSDADDYLGLVSEDDIEIGHPATTGPGDLHIHAAIYAADVFKVGDRYTKSGGTLYIYGSLTAGTLTATEPRYATHIRFDKRLASRRPPNFPTTDRYEIKDWDGKWNIAR